MEKIKEVFGSAKESIVGSRPDPQLRKDLVGEYHHAKAQQEERGHGESLNQGYHHDPRPFCF